MNYPAILAQGATIEPTTNSAAPNTITSTTGTPTSQPVPPLARFLRDNGSLIPLILGLVVLFFFMSRTKKKQEREKQDLLKQLTRGQRVQTIGGIIATVVEARENEVVLKVDETTNTKIKFSRNAIHRVLGDEKAETK